MSAVWFQSADVGFYCRLLTIGPVWHVTGCRARIDATLPVVLTPTEPPPALRCGTCWRDYTVKRSRVPTVDLRPSVREVGVYAELTIEAAPVRGEAQRPAGRLGESAEDDWAEGGIPEVVLRDMTSRGVVVR